MADALETAGQWRPVAETSPYRPMPLSHSRSGAMSLVNVGVAAD